MQDVSLRACHRCLQRIVRLPVSVLIQFSVCAYVCPKATSDDFACFA